MKEKKTKHFTTYMVKSAKYTKAGAIDAMGGVMLLIFQIFLSSIKL